MRKTVYSAFCALLLTSLVACKKKDKDDGTNSINCTTISMSATVSGSSIIVSANGGAAPYKYSRDGVNFQTSNVFENLEIGEYIITVKDVNSCSIVSVPALAVSKGVYKDGRDNKTYQTVKINNLVWMSENFNYNNGANSLCYANSTDSCSKYGRLYGISDLTNGLCPNGWHISTDEDWKNLETSQGMSLSDANIDGTARVVTISKLLKGGSSGFDLLYSGAYNSNVTFGDVGSIASFWTSTESTNGNFYTRGFDVLNVNKIDRSTRNNADSPTYKFCVRCVRD